METSSSLNHRLRFYQGLSLVLLVVSLAASGLAIFYAAGPKTQAPAETPILSENLIIPEYDAIMSLLKDLRYSGIPSVLRKDLDLAIDFENKKWFLKNINRFDEKGCIILEEGRYGLCGQLAAYVYDKIRILLSPRYEIRFARVSESGFFLQPRSTHIVLFIRDSLTSNIFLLDPSFGRYGPRGDFDNYYINNFQNNLGFLENRETDISFDAGFATPLLIKKDIIVLMSVGENSEKFDSQNFMISITANKRFSYSGRYVLLLKKENGMIKKLEDPDLIKKVFPAKIYQELYNRILSWMAS